MTAVSRTSAAIDQMWGDGSDLGAPLQPHGALRRALLDPSRLADRQARADRLLESDGAGHLVHDLPVRSDGRTAALESRPWRVDPIPVVLDPPTFRWLSLAIAERMEALEAVVADLYGPRTLVHERIVPSEALAATDRYRINAVGARPTRWLTTYAVDVALGADGIWYVVQDLTDAPPGIGYAMLDRSVISRVLPDVMANHEVASIARYTGAMRRALAAATSVDSPRIVLFSGGLDHPSYIDHSYLAVQLGVHLVEGADLVVRQRRVWLRTLDGLEPVDVLYRRLEDPTIDPLEVAAHGRVGVPGLLQAVRSGGVALANAHGAGVLEATEVVPFIEAAIEWLHPMEQALPRLRDLSAPFAHVPVAPSAGTATGIEAGLVVRLFAVHDGSSVVVLPRRHRPGARARRRPPLAHGLHRQGRVGARPHRGPDVRPAAPAGRLRPFAAHTRAADALYWTNRAAERAESMARAGRVVASRLEQDPGLVALHGGGWAERMIAVVAAIRNLPGGPTPVAATPDPARDAADALVADLSDLGRAVADEIGALLTEATTVREYLSVTTGRVLAHLAALRAGLARGEVGVDDLDAVLTDFAAFAGLWHESIVRGPAWRIGDTGRRLERALVVIDLVESAIGPERTGRDDDATARDRRGGDRGAAGGEREPRRLPPPAPQRRRARRRCRTAAPRRQQPSVARHRRSTGCAGTPTTAVGQPGIELAERARRTRCRSRCASCCRAARAVIEELGMSVVERWFSSPVSPILMRPTDDVAAGGVPGGASGAGTW